MDKNRKLLTRTSERLESCIVYVMGRDQRVQDNFALLAARQKALELSLPSVVIFNLKNNLQP